MYNLDSQFKFNNEEGIYKLGQWLARKLLACDEKLNVVEEILLSCGFTETILRHEWAAQIEAQRRPLPRKCNSTGSHRALTLTLNSVRSTQR